MIDRRLLLGAAAGAASLALPGGADGRPSETPSPLTGGALIPR